MADPQDLPDAFASNELVVDLGLVGEVQQHLAALNVVWARDVDHSEPLGLARLRGLVDARGPVTDLDGLMFEVRRLHGNSTALGDRLGKNRFVDSIVGSSGTKPMSLGTKPMLGGEPGAASGFEVVGGAADGAGVRIRVIDVPLPEAGPQQGLLAPKAGHSLFVISRIEAEAPAADFQVRPVLDAVTGRATLWDTAVAMVAVAGEDVDIINMSLGCYTTDGRPPLVLQRAVSYAAERALVVAAAGNHGDLSGWVQGRSKHSNTYPAALPEVIAVGATDPTSDDGAGPFTPARFSPDLPWVTCTARGVGLVGRYLTGQVQLRSGSIPFSGQAVWSGTSFATATVTGAIAAQMSRTGEGSPSAALELLLAADGDVRPFTATDAGIAAFHAGEDPVG